MHRLTHFAATFAIIWAILTAAYMVLIFREGFAVGWRGKSAPPMWVLNVVFYVWPAIPAALIAGCWELVRAAASRRN